jgi:hypothetical protein
MRPKRHENAIAVVEKVSKPDKEVHWGSALVDFLAEEGLYDEARMEVSPGSSLLGNRAGQQEDGTAG